MNNAQTTHHYKELTPLYTPKASPLLKLVVNFLRVAVMVTILYSLWTSVSGLDWEVYKIHLQYCPYEGHANCSDSDVGSTALMLLIVHSILPLISYTRIYVEEHVPSWSREYHIRSIKGKAVILPIMWAIIFLVSWAKKRLLFRGAFISKKFFAKKSKIPIISQKIMRIFFLILAILSLVSIDFATKIYFHGPFQNMFLNGDLYWYFPVLSDIFGVKLIYNTGIAFGLPITGIFLKILTFAIIAILCYYYIKHEFPKKNLLIDSAFVCIFAGAISHGYERIFVGHVIDFFAVKNFAIFNFADIFITIGGILFLIYTIFYDRK